MEKIYGKFCSAIYNKNKSRFYLVRAFWVCKTIAVRAENPFCLIQQGQPMLIFSISFLLLRFLQQQLTAKNITATNIMINNIMMVWAKEEEELETLKQSANDRANKMEYVTWKSDRVKTYLLIWHFWFHQRAGSNCWKTLVFTTSK